MTQITTETIPAPFATRAKHGTAALSKGQPITRIVWIDSPLGELHFCWQYHNAAFAAEVAEKLISDPGHIEANWRTPNSNRFYTTSREG
jgi:hypothetical protein